MSTQHRKGWHEINWATPRVLTDPEFVKNVVHPYDAIPNTGTFVAARVTGAPWQPCLSRVQFRSSAVTTWDAAVLLAAHELNQHRLAVSLQMFCSLPGITDTAVLLESGASSVPYEFLVLAPGSTYPEPAIKGFSGSLADRKATIQVHQTRSICSLVWCVLTTSPRLKLLPLMPVLHGNSRQTV